MKMISKRFSMLLAALAFLAQAPPPAPPAKTSLAIYPIKAAGTADQAVASALTSLLSSELTPSPRLSVIEEGMLKEVMARQALNESDACDDTSCQVAIGKLVKAQKMITGDIVKLGSRYTLSLKLVDIQTGTMEFTTKDGCPCNDDQVEQLVVVAGAKIRNYFGESVPVVALPQAPPPGGQAFLPVPTSPVSTSPPGAQAFLPAQPSAPAQKTFQEYHPEGAKGGPMVFISDFKFYIDKFEVANQDFQECVSAGACKETKKESGYDAPNQPVVYVNQDDARTYCQWAGKRLPKEQEWQEAAQGTDGRTYPWGNQSPNCNLVNYSDCKRGRTLPVGSKPTGASPYGALDMAGNVWEWVEEKSVVRGGSWFDTPSILHVSTRDTYYPRGRNSYGGLRCARDGSP